MKLVNENNFTNDTDKNNLLEQYKTYVESADKVSDRRMGANTFFITLNSALITVMTIFSSNTFLLLILSFLGIIFSLLWFSNLKYYKQINSCKFDIIQQVEKYLPINLYTVEWDILNNSNKKYTPVSKLEMFLPFVFVIIYASIILYFLITKVEISIIIK